MPLLRKLSRFSIRDILGAINQLIDEVNRLQPRPSSGTLLQQGSQGATRKGASAAGRQVKASGGNELGGAARWQ